MFLSHTRGLSVSGFGLHMSGQIPRHGTDTDRSRLELIFHVSCLISMIRATSKMPKAKAKKKTVQTPTMRRSARAAQSAARTAGTTKKAPKKKVTKKTSEED